MRLWGPEGGSWGIQGVNTLRMYEYYFLFRKKSMYEYYVYCEQQPWIWCITRDRHVHVRSRGTRIIQGGHMQLWWPEGVVGGSRVVNSLCMYDYYVYCERQPWIWCITRDRHVHVRSQGYQLVRIHAYYYAF